MANAHIIRQLKHWLAASERLGDFSLQGSDQPWQALERYTNVSVRDALERTRQRLLNRGLNLQQTIATRTIGLAQASKLLDDFKSDYLRTETLFDFYVDAINNRAGEQLSRILRACDIIAWRSMHKLLMPLGYETPPVLTYIDKGLGASILKAGLRLWDQNTDNPVAMIKVVRHNLFRPTSLVHEAGHQVAHILNWNEELKQILRQRLRGVSDLLADIWSGWASEIAADVFAFVHTGYGSVASLHDVVAGSSRQVFRYIPGDPHPISFLRLLLGSAFCKISFGTGAWDNLVQNWKEEHRIDHAEREVREIVNHSLPLLEKIASTCLHNRLETMGGKNILERISLEKINPKVLDAVVDSRQLEDDRWILQQDPLALLAQSSWKIAVSPSSQDQFVNYQFKWMNSMGAYQPAYL